MSSEGLGERSSVTAAVSPLMGDAYYHVNMTVTDAYGCSATSEYARVYVKDNPHVVIVPVTENGGELPYCPTVGRVHLVVVSAEDSTFVPNLTYQWTSSQSLDISSYGDTAGLYVLPILCSHIYDAQVFVTDTIYGCTATASILIPVEDKAPIYIGEEHHDIVPVVDSCKMRVTDFTHYVNSATIDNICGWPFERYTIWQEPAVGTEMTVNTPVTVFIKTPCDEDVVAIS